MILLLIACSQDIQVASGQEGCEDYDFANPGESKITSEWQEDGTAKVARIYDLQPMTSLVFEPEITAEGDLVHVREAWTGGVDEVEFCYQPYVLVSGVEVRQIEVRWYEGDDETPFGSALVEPQ